MPPWLLAAAAKLMPYAQEPIDMDFLGMGFALSHPMF
jgi:hypothetical protein